IPGRSAIHYQAPVAPRPGAVRPTGPAGRGGARDAKALLPAAATPSAPSNRPRTLDPERPGNYTMMAPMSTEPGPSPADPDGGPDDPGRGSLSEAFVTRVAGAQRPLYAYIRSLLGPWGDAEDILQEVNVVLCRKAHEYDGRGQFLTWACRVAYF